jgi:thiamine biosynthesis protein ThiS
MEMGMARPRDWLYGAGMRVEVNGERHEVDSGTTVLGLLRQLGVASGPVAVERNREIVPRAHHETTALDDGDQLEVVQFVGGG